MRGGGYSLTVKNILGEKVAESYNADATLASVIA
jgi:hypothetical protein